MKLRGFLDPADAIVVCKTCGSVEGQPCKLDPPKKGRKPFRKGTVHISRRISRLLLTARNPSLRESFEREAVKLLKEYLKGTTP